jgi:hypothetical protein
MNRVMNHALNGLAALGFDLVGDFHAPSWAQLGNLKEDSSSIFGELDASNVSRMLIVVVGAIIAGPLQRSGLGRVTGWFTGVFLVERSAESDCQAIVLCAQADWHEQRLTGGANPVEATGLSPITGPAEKSTDIERAIDRVKPSPLDSGRERRNR